MAKNYIQPGNVLDYEASSAKESGDVVDLDTRIGIALADIAQGEVGPVQVEGVFELPKVSGALSVGTEVYWNGTAITTTSTDNPPAGYVARAGESGDGVVHVKLKG